MTHTHTTHLHATSWWNSTHKYTCHVSCVAGASHLKELFLAYLPIPWDCVNPSSPCTAQASKELRKRASATSNGLWKPCDKTQGGCWWLYYEPKHPTIGARQSISLGIQFWHVWSSKYIIVSMYTVWSWGVHPMIHRIYCRWVETWSWLFETDWQLNSLTRGKRSIFGLK